MRILFANSMPGFGGGERWLLDAAAGLARRGHDVTVAGRPGRALVARAAQAGLRTLDVPFANDVDPRSVAALARFARAERPDVVLAQIQRAHRLCALAGVGPRRPALVLRLGQVRPLRRRLLSRFAWGRTRLVLANCEAVAHEARASGLVPSERVRVLRSGVPPSARPGREEARRAAGAAPGDEVVLCAARLGGLKGHAVLLDAWREVARSRPRAVLVLAGGGALEASLRARVAAEGWNGRVRILGEVADMAPLWAAADASVLPSLEEGLPYAVLESMAAGVPCVATRVAGVPELLAHERTGLTVPPRDARALAAELSRVLADRDLARSLARAARARLEAGYSYEAMLDRAEALLEEAAGA